MGPTFLWQTQIQTIEHGLNDAMRIEKNDVIPSDMNFGKSFVREKLVPWNQFILSML